MSDDKQIVYVVSVAIAEADRLYAENLRIAMRQLLEEDGMEGHIRVSVVKLPR